jgi:hypothetical protein
MYFTAAGLGQIGATGVLVGVGLGVLVGVGVGLAVVVGVKVGKGVIDVLVGDGVGIATATIVVGVGDGRSTIDLKIGTVAMMVKAKPSIPIATRCHRSSGSSIVTPILPSIIFIFRPKIPYTRRTIPAMAKMVSTDMAILLS